MCFMGGKNESLATCFERGLHQAQKLADVNPSAQGQVNSSICFGHPQHPTGSGFGCNKSCDKLVNSIQIKTVSNPTESNDWPKITISRSSNKKTIFKKGFSD